MSVSVIRNVINFYNDPISFINTESSRDNRNIAPGSQSIPDIGGWVPWCTRSQDFQVHHMQITDQSSNQVMWYIWQQQASDGDWVRFSREAFGNSDVKLPVGSTYTVVLWSDGTIRATVSS